MSDIVKKTSVVKEATQIGVHARSPRQRGTASNLYHLVISLAKISAVLMRTEALRSVAQTLADDLSLHIEIDALDKKECVSVADFEDGEEEESHD